MRVERRRQLCGDVRGCLVFDLMALHHVEQLAAAQDRDRRGRGWIAGEVAARPFGGLHVGAANTVVTRSGVTVCCNARATPGRALPAAHPQTEFTTTMTVPGVFMRTSSTSAAAATLVHRGA